jgi:uncharacterized protein YhjY with autotransporter beta-barrel domain
MIRIDDSKTAPALEADPAARHVGMALANSWELTNSHVMHGLVATWAYKRFLAEEPIPTRDDTEQFITKFRSTK